MKSFYSTQLTYFWYYKWTKEVKPWALRGQRVFLPNNATTLVMIFQFVALVVQGVKYTWFDPPRLMLKTITPKTPIINIVYCKNAFLNYPDIPQIISIAAFSLWRYIQFSKEDQIWGTLWLDSHNKGMRWV